MTSFGARIGAKMGISKWESSTSTKRFSRAALAPLRRHEAVHVPRQCRASGEREGWLSRPNGDKVEEQHPFQLRRPGAAYQRRVILPVAHLGESATPRRAR